MSPGGSLSETLSLVASSGEETDLADEFQLDSLSPQSPPDHERGPQPIEYVPKSPVYPLHLITAQKKKVYLSCESCSGQMTPETEEPKKVDHVNNMEVPVDLNADKDHFKDVDRPGHPKAEARQWTKTGPLEWEYQWTTPARAEEADEDCQASPTRNFGTTWTRTGRPSLDLMQLPRS